MKGLYTAIVTVHGGREGHIRSSDGILDMDLRVPKELGGPGGLGTNPEQLFASGYAACFESAIRHVARSQHKAVKDVCITAHVTLNATDEKKFILSVELHGKIEGLTKDESLALMRVAHEVCPYSNATRGNVDVTLFVD
jgi:osmotically inducible protein OsmC